MIKNQTNEIELVGPQKEKLYGLEGNLENDDERPEEDVHNNSGLPSHLLKGLLAYGIQKEMEDLKSEDEYG